MLIIGLGLGLGQLSTLAVAQSSVPAGTILPIRLDTTIAAPGSPVGQRVTGTLMQDVLIGGMPELRRGTKIIGTVSASAQTADGRGEVAIRFDHLQRGNWSTPVKVSLRALAGESEVENAKVPAQGSDRGTPEAAYTTIQIGGEVVYRGGGPVMDNGQVVGKPVAYGIVAPARPDPKGLCHGAMAGNSQPQAFWLFSSNACGVYGISRVVISHKGSGTNATAGTIVLTTERGQLKIGSGSGMLLRVTAPETPSSASQ
jgi:hypothetical protein